jgi:dTDP-glucose 4,6-dehydratase
LWALLARGQSINAYNVGSEQEVSIRHLAAEVVKCTNREVEVVVNGVDTSENVTRYVPSVERIKKEIGVSQSVSLHQSLLRTSNWLKETALQQ